MVDTAELIRKSGLAVTAQRLSILKAVAREPHITADTIADQVRSELGTVSRQAVYNSLGAMVDKGLIRRIQPAGSPALYEDRVGDNHHHLICRKCGATVDIDCVVGKAPCLTPDDDHGYEIDEAEIIFWGLCPECQ